MSPRRLECECTPRERARRRAVLAPPATDGGAGGSMQAMMQAHVSGYTYTQDASAPTRKPTTGHTPVTGLSDT